MKKKIMIPICAIVVLFIVGAILSISKFSTYNPIASFFGMIEISTTDKEYKEIQSNPYKVIISKSANAQHMLDKYMSERGFTELARYGSHITYSNGIETERVHFSVNEYYSIWKWNR